jgi:hypothetical protein
MEKWKERSYEMRRLRRELSQKAKQINAEANAKRKVQLLELEDSNALENLHASHTKEHQLNVLDVVCQSGKVFSDETQQQPPAMYRPIALANYASHQADGPVPDSEALVGLPHGEVEVRDDDALVNTISESTQFLHQHGIGLHGLADSEFGVSEAILEEASKQQGFVANSNLQFESLYSQVCDEESEFTIKDKDAIDCMKSCQQLCGRYCKKDIDKSEHLTNCVEMLKTIARVVASKRDVKVWHMFHLGPSCRLPVLILHTPTGLCARLASRVSFNPLEIDWIHCNVECVACDDKETYEYRVTLQFDFLDATDRLCPLSDSMCELAIWLSKTFEGGDGFQCQLFTEYDLDDANDHILVLRSSHESSSINAIDNSSFQDLVDRSSRRKDKPLVDEDIAAKSLGSLISILNKDSKKTRKTNQSKTTKSSSSALTKLTGKAHGIMFCNMQFDFILLMIHVITSHEFVCYCFKTTEYTIVKETEHIILYLTKG